MSRNPFAVAAMLQRLAGEIHTVPSESMAAFERIARHMDRETFEAAMHDALSKLVEGGTDSAEAFVRAFVELHLPRLDRSKLS